MRWVAIDGIDCVGKTTAVQDAAELLRSRGVPTLTIGEFSSGPVGDLLRATLMEHRFLSLAGSGNSPAADTFVLLADLLYSIETTMVDTIAPDAIVLSDRGPVSLVAYQASRLASAGRWIDASSLSKVVATALGGHSPATVVLEGDIDVLARRARERDGEPWSQGEHRWMAATQESVLSLAANGDLGPFLGSVRSTSLAPMDVARAVVHLVIEGDDLG